MSGKAELTALQETMQFANGHVMWIFAAILMLTVMLQSVIFITLANKLSNKCSLLTTKERRSIYKTATITTLGPSLAIIFIAISLISNIGGPMTLMRIGVIGNAATESFTANQGAIAAGTELGNNDYGLLAFSSSVWIMTLSGMGWLIISFICTPKLAIIQEKLKKSDPASVSMIGYVVTIVLFSVLIINQFLDFDDFTIKVFKLDYLVASIATLLTFFILNHIGKTHCWVKEWAIGIGFISGLFFGQLTHSVM